MIGLLPKSLEIDGREYEINSDFRVALLIFEAYNDTKLSDYEKAIICLKCLYKEIPQNLEIALQKAVWFLDGGDMPKSKKSQSQIMDWEQDQSIIFPAINKVAGYETRMAEYIHWWTFIGFFNEIDDGLFSQVMNIRAKKAKGKKLEKWEQEFYKEHKELIEIKHKLTAEEQVQEKAELDFINSLV